MAVKQRRQAKPINLVVSSDYQEDLPSDLLRSYYVKVSGVNAASATGVNALDGPINILGKVELARGDAMVSLMAMDCLHVNAFLTGAYQEVSAAPASAAAFLGQFELPFDALIPGGAIDARGGNVVLRGRTRPITSLGTTATAITSGKIRHGGETAAISGRAFWEPFWFQRSLDCSSEQPEISNTYQVAHDLEVCPAIMLRCHDASAELADPNTARSDGMVKTIKIDLERNGDVKELKRLTWGEAKMATTQAAKIALANVKSGVVIIPLEDPAATDTFGRLKLLRGDKLTVRIDTTVASIEGEFTNLTVAAGDLCYVTFLNYVPAGTSVAAARRRG